jgi:hypothetical protein
LTNYVPSLFPYRIHSEIMKLIDSQLGSLDGGSATAHTGQHKHTTSADRHLCLK